MFMALGSTVFQASGPILASRGLLRLGRLGLGLKANLARVVAKGRDFLASRRHLAVLESRPLGWV